MCALSAIEPVGRPRVTVRMRARAEQLPQRLELVGLRGIDAAVDEPEHGVVREPLRARTVEVVPQRGGDRVRRVCDRGARARVDPLAAADHAACPACAASRGRACR